MNSFRLLTRSIAHYRRAHFGLLLGTALAGAILTGALAVGDSVTHTLHTYAQQRLGRTQLAITSGDRMFSAELGTALAQKTGAPVSTVFALPGMAIYQNPSNGQRTQVNRVQALGVDAAFWSFADEPPVFDLKRREAVLDTRLAATLGVKPGDTVALRISKPGLLSRDAPLSSRQEESSQRANFIIKAIATDAQLGRFSLAASQLPPANFFVNIDDLQQLANAAGQADLLLIGPGASEDAAKSALDAVWKPQFAGLSVAQHANNVLQLESNRIFFDEPTANAALSLPDARGTLTYLVNAIHTDAHSTPYSFMTAGSPLVDGVADNEIAINQWLADQLAVGVGAQVTVKYFEVLPSNKFVEQARAFTVKRVLSMDEIASEKELVPEFPGLSNVESCKDWKIGMPMDEKMLDDKPNEAYWREYHETPKALITLAAGQSMWANRFGKLTAVRFDNASQPDAVFDQLAQHLHPSDVSLEVRPVQDEAVMAASQASELGGLFLGLSFFLLGSAFALTGLLYAFGIQQRAEELGVLAAIGFTKGRMYRLLLVEAFAIALPGALLGAIFGMGYAWALMAGLTHYWQNAVGRIPILFATTPMSIAVGVVGTITCAVVIAALTVRRLLKHSVSELVNADFSQEARVKSSGKVALVSAVLSIVLSVALVVYALVAPPTDAAGVFFGSGALALIAGLLFARHLLSRTAKPRATQPPTTFSLAILNATRRRGRSLGIVSSLAAGGFLVLAVSSMQTDVSADADKRSAGTGGFALYADATVPILDTADVEKAAPGAKAMGLRVFDGDDASCLNLNHAVRPRVLGVDEKTLSEMRAFVDESGDDLWALLNQDLGNGIVPALVGDSDTAMWTLKKSTGPDGDSLAYKDEAGRDISLKLVGKLPMRLSVFQGTVLVSAKRFTDLWPSQEGFRVFLIDAPADKAQGSIDSLQKAFDRYGLDVTTTVARLEMFHAVESTYLSMFLVLGGVGLLLGASATGVVVLRNLLERRREIALLRAVGFSPRAVFNLLATEYGLLLTLGAAIGAIASIISMVPALTSSHTGMSPLWRLAVFAVVLASALLCAYLALLAGLRKTDTTELRAE